jgi:hypothetical protein
MSFHSNHYCVVNASDLSSIDFSQVEDDSPGALRYSLDGSKFIVEYSGVKPSFLAGLTDYTHTQIKDLIHDVSQGWHTNEID